MISVFYMGHLNTNPSYNVLFDALVKIAPADIEVHDINTLTIGEITKQAAESSLLVVDNSLYMGKAYANDSLSTVFIGSWKGKAFYEEAFDILLEQNRVPCLYIASGWDLHWPGPEIKAILERIDALAWMFEKKPVTLDEVPPQYQDTWMKRHDDPLDNWHTVRHMVGTRIELMHSLALDEFSQKPISQSSPKIWDTCVAGVRYSTRQIARKSIDDSGLSVAPYGKAEAAATRTMRTLSGAINPSTASRLWIRWRQWNQSILVSRSRMNFVCGSGLLYPVRKYFEVPANGSVMVAMPCLGFEDYGFKDGVSCVTTAPEDAGQTMQQLKEKHILREQLCTRARDVVLQRHTAQQRALDLIECMQRMDKGSLRGAQFVEGQFEIQ